MYFQCNLKWCISLLTVCYCHFCVCVSGCTQCSAVSWTQHWHMCSLATEVCKRNLYSETPPDIQNFLLWNSPVNFQYERQNGIQLSSKLSHGGCFEFCPLLKLVWDGKFHKIIIFSPIPLWFLSWSDWCGSKQRCLCLSCSQNSPTAR